MEGVVRRPEWSRWITLKCRGNPVISVEYLCVRRLTTHAPQDPAREKETRAGRGTTFLGLAVPLSWGWAVMTSGLQEMLKGTNRTTDSCLRLGKPILQIRDNPLL